MFLVMVGAMSIDELVTSHHVVDGPARRPGSSSAPAEGRDSGGTAVIRLSNVHVDRAAVRALTEISLWIDPGAHVAVIGPNGAGKSTLFALVSGRLSATGGTVTVEGTVAEVLQTTALDPQLRFTVEDVVRMGRYHARGFLGPLRAADRRAVDDAIERVRLTDVRRRSIDTLSGGQRQRALLAQGLAQDASILLLDEPTTGLDAPSRRRILDIIDEERSLGRTILCATHDLADASRADLVVVLACRCLCCAPPTTALADPSVIALFATRSTEVGSAASAT